MKKRILTVLAMVLIPISAHCDEIYKFVKITCAEKAGFLEVQATSIHNAGYLIWEKTDPEKLNLHEINTLRKQFGLYLGSYSMGIIKNICTINDKKIRTQISYNRTKERGQCAANPSAVLNVWVDDYELIKNASFHEDCFDGPSIYKVSLELINGEPFIDLSIRKGSYHSFYRAIITRTDYRSKGPIIMEDVMKSVFEGIKREGGK